MISLLMLSGGIDSTYALYKLLRETDDEVLVHHVHLITDIGRHIPEAEACQKIASFCRQNVRSFYYTESTIDHRRFLAHGFDLAAAGFEAGVVAASFRLATEATRTRHQYVDRWIVGYSRDDDVPSERFVNAQRCCEANCSRGYPPKLFIFPRIDVRDQVDYLPRELFEMTWSCRRPQRVGDEVAQCRTCASCIRRMSVERRHAMSAA